MDYDITAVGELLIDFAAKGKNELGYPVMEANPGGAPANFLAAAAACGKRTALIGKVGRDAFGRLLTDTLAAAGIDYIELGRKTGEMAAQILKGEASASEMDYETFETPKIYFNQQAAEDLGLTIDESILTDAEIFTEITEE